LYDDDTHPIIFMAMILGNKPYMLSTDSDIVITHVYIITHVQFL